MSESPPSDAGGGGEAGLTAEELDRLVAAAWPDLPQRPGPGLDEARRVARLIAAARAQSVDAAKSEALWDRKQLGQAVYMAMYGHFGGRWEVNNDKDVWFNKADLVLAALSTPSKEQQS